MIVKKDGEMNDISKMKDNIPVTCNNKMKKPLVLQQLIITFLFPATAVSAFQLQKQVQAPHFLVPSRSSYLTPFPKKVPSPVTLFASTKQNNRYDYSPQSPRRSFLKQSITNYLSLITLLTQNPYQANAAPSSNVNVKGAAEYDFEYYMRTLMSGNKKEGSIQPSQPPPTPPPRHMSSFIRNIVNESFDGTSCITVSQLSQLLKNSSTAASTSVSSLDISNKMISFRNKVANVYKTKQPWEEESIQDEYYFDLTCYALYRIAAELIPTDYALRDQWVRSVGKEIYNSMKKEKLVTLNNNNNENETMKKKKLTEIIQTLIQLLDSFKSIGFIQDYRLGEKNDIQQRMGKNIFDEYDDDDIDSGLNVNLLVSIFRPATLGSSLQITGEGSRFSPDFVSPTIAALLEEQCGLKVEFEGYFVDEEYRPNPKDFFPNEQLLQFTLSRKLK
jgi:hypothetical protein